jgi:DNA (cytosine-5)-methyltransferase 1
VLAHRFPGVPVYDDVRGVGSGLRDAPNGRGITDPGHGRDRLRAASVDLLCGGFPCQDLSVAGRRAGLTGGERSSLFFEFARCADELVPTGGWILIENVPGLLSSQNGRDFALVLATLAELGFHDLAWRVLDSRHFGVPQRRRRVFIVGRRATGRRSFEILLEPEGGGGDPQACGEAGAGVAGTLGGGSRSRGWAQDVERMTFGPVGSLLANGGDGHFNDADAGRLVADTLTSGSHPGSNMPGRRREDDTNLVAFDWQSGGDVRLNIGPQTSALIKEQTPAVTSNAGVRRLTPIECERLQGLPDNWTQVPDTAPDSRRYAGLGDAVTSPVAEWIGRRILAHHQEDT